MAFAFSSQPPFPDLPTNILRMERGDLVWFSLADKVSYFCWQWSFCDKCVECKLSLSSFSFPSTHLLHCQLPLWNPVVEPKVEKSVQSCNKAPFKCFHRRGSRTSSASPVGSLPQGLHRKYLFSNFATTFHVLFSDISVSANHNYHYQRWECGLQRFHQEVKWRLF